MTTIKFQGNTTIGDTLLENPQSIPDAELLALFLTAKGDSTALDKAKRVLDTTVPTKNPIQIFRDAAAMCVL
jgi:hypothetical protein